jgi:hypothetical protein
MTALADLLRNPEPGDKPMRHIDLAASGYLLLDVRTLSVPRAARSERPSSLLCAHLGPGD